MTTGINNRTGEHPARWEINAPQAEGGLRWLAALQNKTEENELSHFSISDIRGMPRAPFNGVGPVSGGSGGGFRPRHNWQHSIVHMSRCTRYDVIGSVSDTISYHANSKSSAQRIASEYSGHPNASAYREAGQVFCLPYWN
ncbi:hypothetical protein K449DRAFT_54623 [Hypoxylon sp. EC38]|nr:hypothetical protein K449DRAFT_54623 [Hypoxylon sp. EC38]